MIEFGYLVLRILGDMLLVLRSYFDFIFSDFAIMSDGSVVLTYGYFLIGALIISIFFKFLLAIPDLSRGGKRGSKKGKKNSNSSSSSSSDG